MISSVSDSLQLWFPTNERITSVMLYNRLMYRVIWYQLGSNFIHFYRIFGTDKGYRKLKELKSGGGETMVKET